MDNLLENETSELLNEMERVLKNDGIEHKKVKSRKRGNRIYFLIKGFNYLILTASQPEEKTLTWEIRKKRPYREANQPLWHNGSAPNLSEAKKQFKRWLREEEMKNTFALNAWSEIENVTTVPCNFSPEQIKRAWKKATRCETDEQLELYLATESVQVAREKAKNGFPSYVATNMDVYASSEKGELKIDLYYTFSV